MTPNEKKPDEKPPQEKPPIAEEKKEEISPEEMEQRVNAALAVFGSPTPKKEKAKKEEDKPKEEKKVEPPKEEKVEEKKEPEKKPDKKDEPKEEDAILKRLDDVEDKIDKASSRPPREERKREPESRKTEDITREDIKNQKRARVIEQLAKDYPETYGSHPKQFREFVALEREYATKWAKENPGKRFDPNSEDHEEFYAEHEPVIDQDDYVESLANLTASERVDADRRAREEQAARETVAVKINESVKKSTAWSDAEVAKMIDPEAKNLEDLRTRIEPGAEWVIDEVKSSIKNAVQTAELLFTPGSGEKIDIKNPVHAWLLDMVTEEEKKLAELPRSKTNLGKKRFATVEELRDMAPEDRRDYWTIWMQPDQLRPIISAEIGKLAKADIEKETAKIQKHYTRKEKESRKTSGSDKTTDTKPADKETKPPSTTGGSRNATPGANEVVDKEDKFAFMDKALGGVLLDR